MKLTLLKILTFGVPCMERTSIWGTTTFFSAFTGLSALMSKVPPGGMGEGIVVFGVWNIVMQYYHNTETSLNRFIYVNTQLHRCRQILGKLVHKKISWNTGYKHLKLRYWWSVKHKIRTPQKLWEMLISTSTSSHFFSVFITNS